MNAIFVARFAAATKRANVNTKAFSRGGKTRHCERRVKKIKNLQNIYFKMDEHPTEELDFDQTDFEYAMGQRNFRRQTKEERIYGIWAQQDEDDERPSFGGRDSKKRKKDSAPVQFVSSGVKNASKTEEMPDIILAEDEDEIIIDAIPEKKMKPAFGAGKAKMMAKEAGSQVFAGMRTATFQGTSSSTSTDSAWMKSGKANVIMQMMQKMGYEQGKGLGKSKQGIVEPVQAVPRPGRGAVGAYGSEAKGPKFGESAADAQVRIRSGGDVDPFNSGVDPFPEPGGGAKWRKGNANRVRVQYRTLDDVISEGENQQFSGLAASASIGKIIDMTGPEQKVYDDFTSFSRRSRRPGASTVERTNFNIPELSHNLDTLLDVTEEEICKTDKQIRHLKDQNEVIASEQNRLEEELAESQEEIRRLEEVHRLIRHFHQKPGESSLEECKQLFQTLRTEYAVEFTLFGLDAIAIPILLPKISAFFSGWDPLDPEQISYGFEMMTEWREIIGNIKGGALFKHFEKDKAGTLSAYDHCIWDGWMPNLRRAALAWNPRENGPVMVSLVQQWMPILPNWVLENFLEQVLVPKIKDQVEAWDPATDPVPIETWLHPWHAVMGDRLLLIYATLRQKLAKGLRNWAPGDRSAIESIRPWKNVFSTSAMHTFVSMNILPKLERSLQTIDIGTTEHFDYIELFDWLGLTTVDAIAQMLAKYFFPRYYQQICYQMNSPNLSMAEFEKIKKGYIDWKNLMPSEIQKHELIMIELKRVLLLISQTQSRLTGVPLPQTSRPIQPVAPQPTMPMPPGPFGLPPPTHFTSQLPPANFKHLVESSAISNGIQFFPQRDKKQDGKQVYMFGDFSVYLDGTLLYAYNPTRRQWLPASLNQMLDMVRNR